MTPDPCTVAIVEDHPLMRAALVRTVAAAGAVVVAEADNAQDGYERLRAARPNVAVIDIELGRESGVELTRRLLRADRYLGVIVYTGSEDVVALKDALDCGARGFVFKTSGPSVLITALQSVARGGTYVDDEARAQIRMLDRDATPRVLSDREREVLGLMSQGLTGDDVAEQLALSPETVKTHVRNATRKLNARNRTHAVVQALRNGEIGL